MLFNCSLLATGLCNLTSTTHLAKGDELESYLYSKWRITNCSPVQTQTMITILDQMTQYFPSVINAVQKGTESAPYRLFFKSNREIPLVQTVFANLGAGEQVKAGSDTHILQHAPPEFICTTTSGFTKSYYEWCNDSHFEAVTFTHMEYVVLCPSFWTDLYPTQLGDVERPSCPSLKNATEFPEGDPMLGSKLAIVVHELIHLYMENQIAPEIYSMRLCVELSATKAAHNANNFTFFAMSILMNCMDWPAGLKRSLGRKRALAAHGDSSVLARSRDRSEKDLSSLLSLLPKSGLQR